MRLSNRHQLLAGLPLGGLGGYLMVLAQSPLAAVVMGTIGLISALCGLCTKA